MPNVGGKKFAYTKKGIAAAKKEAAKMGVKKPAAKKPAVKKGDGMMTTKEIAKIYEKAKNKKGKYDPTKIPGFKFGKGTK